MEQQFYQSTLAYEYAFRILIDKVSLCTGVPCSVKLLIRRGSQKIKPKQSSHLDGTSKYGFFQELLSLKTKVYCDSLSSVFWDKKISFTLLIETPSGSKLAGVANYNLASLLNGQSSTVYEVLKLHKCPDPNAKIFIRLEKQFLTDLGKVNVDASQQTIMSDDDDFLDITFSNDSQNNISLSSNLQQQPSQQDKNDALPLKCSNFSFSNNHQLSIDPNSKKSSNQFTFSASSQKKNRNDENSISENRLNISNSSSNSKNISQLTENEKILALEEHAKIVLKEKKIMKKELQDLRSIMHAQNNLLSMKNHENDKLQEELDAMRAERDELKWLMDELKQNADNIEGQIFSKFELMKQDFSNQLSLSQERERYLLKQNEEIQMKVKQLIQDNNSCTERALMREKEIFDLKYQINFLENANTNNNDFDRQYPTSKKELEQQDTLQRLLLENKFKDEQIQKFTHKLNSIQLQIQKQASHLNAQDDEDYLSQQQDQFRPVDNKNAKSFLSNTFNNEFHSCIIQDFKDYGEDFEIQEPDFLYPTPRESANNKHIQNGESSISKDQQEEARENTKQYSRSDKNNALSQLSSL